MPDDLSISGSAYLPCQNDFSGDARGSVGVACPGAAELPGIARLAVSEFVGFDAPLQIFGFFGVNDAKLSDADVVAAHFATQLNDGEDIIHKNIRASFEGAAFLRQKHFKIISGPVAAFFLRDGAFPLPADIDLSSSE